MIHYGICHRETTDVEKSINGWKKDTEALPNPLKQEFATSDRIQSAGCK